MPARGLAADDLKGQIQELVASAAHGRTSRPVHHVHIDPPTDCADPDSVIKAFVTAYEREFGLEEAPTCAVRHIKDGREHEHRVWSLVCDDGSVVSLAHDHARREKISRIVEFEHGLPFTKGKHNRSVAAAFRKDGRQDVADAMEEAGLLSGKPAIAHSTPRERAQAERTAIPLDEVRSQVFLAWQASVNSHEFAEMLDFCEFSLAEGARGLVIVDRSGATHSLNRILAAAARRAGTDRITAAIVRKRLAGLKFLSVEEVQNGRNATRESTKSGRGDLSGGPLRKGDEPGVVAASQTSGRGLAGGTVAAGRTERFADGDRPDSGEAWRDSDSPRRSVNERASAPMVWELAAAMSRCSAKMSPTRA